jgi:rsbT antagonist protein RsbS
MPVPILKQGECLIATLPATISDSEWRDLQDGLLARVGQIRCRGVIVDVSELDVMDSFATRALSGIAEATRLCGALTVLVGIQPEIAYSMVQLGLTARFQGVSTALDLEEGLAYLNGRDRRRQRDDHRER